jgi:hypothetical protein
MKALGLLLTLVALSCSDPSPLGPNARAPRPQRDLVGLPTPTGLLQCTPLAADSAVQTIGPAGGTLQVGPHVFTVPPGALDSAVTISAVAPSDSVNRIVFQPEGLTFNQPASLTMSYANCGLLGLALPKQIVYTTDALAVLEYVTSVDQPSSQTVTGQIGHFSDYAVAW